jgi:GH24 family phage-related lysozyme (muramidase)
MSPKVKAAVAIVAVFAVPFEGLRHYPYYDPPGILTVCFGSTSNVIKGRYYPIEECKTRLERDVSIAVTHVDRCVPKAPVAVLAAFTDAVYNIGPRIACDQAQSTAARYLAKGEWVRACNELPKWNKARVAGRLVELPGLTKRREAERKLCMSHAE